MLFVLALFKQFVLALFCLSANRRLLRRLILTSAFEFVFRRDVYCLALFVYFFLFFLFEIIISSSLESSNKLITVGATFLCVGCSKGGNDDRSSDNFFAFAACIIALS